MEIDLGDKRGRPRGTYDGPRKKETISRRLERLEKRRYRAKKRGDLQLFKEADRDLKEFNRRLAMFNHMILGDKSKRAGRFEGFVQGKREKKRKKKKG